MDNVVFKEDVVEPIKVNPLLRLWANVVSCIFHPVFVPIYVMYFLVFMHPSYFAGFSEKAKWQTILIASVNLVIYPIITILLLRAVGFIDSIFLRTRKDRIIPYMASGIFFFWAYTVFKKQEHYPPIVAVFILGVFLAASGALLANIYFKVSMHAIGVGGWLGILAVVAISNTMLMTWPIAAVALIGGMVCTARLLLNAHNPKDVYMGFGIGFLCQMVAWYVQ